MGVAALRNGAPPAWLLRRPRTAVIQKTVGKCTRGTRAPIIFREQRRQLITEILGLECLRVVLTCLTDPGGKEGNAA